MEEAWLDITIIRCPHCGAYYAEASWYAIKLESDIECGKCRRYFNTKKNKTDRIMLNFVLNGNGKVENVKVAHPL